MSKNTTFELGEHWTAVNGSVVSWYTVMQSRHRVFCTKFTASWFCQFQQSWITCDHPTAMRMNGVCRCRRLMLSCLISHHQLMSVRPKPQDIILGMTLFIWQNFLLQTKN